MVRIQKAKSGVAAKLRVCAEASSQDSSLIIETLSNDKRVQNKTCSSSASMCPSIFVDWVEGNGFHGLNQECTVCGNAER